MAVCFTCFCVAKQTRRLIVIRSAAASYRIGHRLEVIHNSRAFESGISGFDKVSCAQNRLKTNI